MGYYIFSKNNQSRIKLICFYSVFCLFISYSQNKIITPVPSKKNTTTHKKPIQGIDVSKFQGEIPWQTLTNKIQFAFCKATEGETYIDPDFKENWLLLKHNNITRGAYHFYRSNDDPIKQASFFTKTVQPYLKADIPLVLDIEQGSLIGKTNKDSLANNLLTFLKQVKIITGKQPIIYTSLNFANEYLTQKEFKQYSLWIANYTTNNNPELPNVWRNTSWLFWQKTDQYQENVISGRVDFDLFNGSTSDLQKFITDSANLN